MEALYLVVQRGEGAGRAPRVSAMSKMESEPRVRARRGLGVQVFKVMCAGKMSNGER